MVAAVPMAMWVQIVRLHPHTQLAPTGLPARMVEQQLVLRALVAAVEPTAMKVHDYND